MMRNMTPKYDNGAPPNPKFPESATSRHGLTLVEARANLLAASRIAGLSVADALERLQRGRSRAA